MPPVSTYHGAGAPGKPWHFEQEIRALVADLRIAVIFGGDKHAEGAVLQQTTNPRSWKSYETVAQDIANALTRLGAADVLLLPDDMRLGQRLHQHDVHVAWLNTAGVQGYHTAAHAAAMLEMLGVPYVGHDPLTAATLDNKHAFKRVLNSLGIPTAPSMVWDPGRWSLVDDFIRRVQTELGKSAYVIKPVTGRASLNVHLAETPGQLRAAIESVYELTENLVLVEKYLPGREFCVAVCGPTVARNGRLYRQSRPFTFSAGERAFDGAERIFASMDQRPISAARFRLLEPDREPVQIQQLSGMACRIYDELNLQSIVRLDVRADAEEHLHVLEVNPKPDLKAPTDTFTSLVCSGLSQERLSYDDLILSLLADRLNFLIHHRPSSVPGLIRMLRPSERPKVGFAVS